MTRQPTSDIPAFKSASEIQEALAKVAERLKGGAISAREGNKEITRINKGSKLYWQRVKEEERRQLQAADDAALEKRRAKGAAKEGK